MDCQFSFGPNNAFFCKSDSLWAWSDNNLPEPLRLLLEDPNHPQATKLPFDVAFPMEHGLFSMAWETHGGETWYEGIRAHNRQQLFLGPRYIKLAEYIRRIAKVGEHTTRTVFGESASYFSMSPSGYSFQHLPPALESDMLGRMKQTQPTCVALGVRGSFVALYSNGTVTFDVSAHYPAVDALIRNSGENAKRKGIAYIALNPHAANQYYLVYGDGGAQWNIPNDWVGDVTTVSKSMKPVGSLPSNFGLSGIGLGAVAGGTYPASGESAASTAIHSLGKLWNAYQQQQQQQTPPAYSNNGALASFFNQNADSTGGGFDPSMFGTAFDGMGGFDASSVVSALDPNTIIAGAAGIILS
ncbi:hypothetical protein MKEN_01350800 [Mycena kentingensis (nom. inval.)]|nr:hypothetical protein MKEN_01350800 [Mycena kentingensis (nom. inval.)]